MLKRVRNYVFVLVLSALAGFLGDALAQEPAYVHYDTENGLPTSEVYMSIQDDRGYMWFATDRGLVRFDGYEFVTIRLNDKNADNVFFGFHKDYSGRIWFYTFHNGIGWLEGDSLHFPEFNDALIRELQGSVIVSMHKSKEGELWIGTSGRIPTLKVDPSGEILQLPAKNCSQASGFANSYLRILEGNGLIFGRMPLSHIDSFGTNVQVFSTSGCYHVPYLEKGQKLLYNSSNQGIPLQNGNYCISIEKKLITFNKSEVLSSSDLPDKVTLGIFEEKSGAIWVGMHRSGASRYPHGDITLKPETYLQGHSVSSIFQDQQDGTWLTTLDAGIFYVPDFSIKTEIIEYNNLVSPVTAMIVSDSFLMIGTMHGILLEKQTYEPYASKIAADSFGQIDGLEENSEFIWIHQDLPSDRSLDWRNKTIRSIIDHCFCNYPTNDSIWCVGLQPSDKASFPDYVEDFSSADLTSSRLPIGYNYKGKHYLVGKKGVYALTGKKPNHHWVHQIKYGSDWFYTSIILDEHYSFLGTRKKGVKIYDEKTDESWFIGKEDGLPDDHVTAMVMQDDSTLWIGTRYGVSKISLDLQAKRANVFSLSSLDGLPSSEVSALAITNGQLWAGTKNGLAHFPLNKTFANQSAPTSRIQKILANGSVSDTTNHIYQHDIQVFDFHFAGIDFKGAHENSYRYRLTNADKDWSETKSREIRYILGPGDYTFEVFAGDKNGIWSALPATYSFTILSPFWQRWWFLLLITLFIIAVVSVGFIYRTRQIRLQAEMKLSLAHSQHRALTAQLKPHFLFNAINSIHNYIRKNEREKASAYLLSFSKLIRQILNNSMDPFVSIKEELEMVEKYLTVEQMRFKDKLTFSITIGPEVNAEDWKIPSQMIQPYVENAIWHGLLPKDGAGHILIELSKKGNNLVCSVDDDGVGRRAAEANTENDYQHESQGNRLGEERLELIRSIYKRPIKVEMVDKRNSVGQSTGTKVIMTLPIITDET